MSALHILNEERTADSKLYQPVSGIVSGIVDWALDDDTDPDRHFTPAERPATATQNDTLWIDINHDE